MSKIFFYFQNAEQEHNPPKTYSYQLEIQDDDEYVNTDDEEEEEGDVPYDRIYPDKLSQLRDRIKSQGRYLYLFCLSCWNWLPIKISNNKLLR